jgi:AraC-like DNA-binding protein
MDPLVGFLDGPRARAAFLVKVVMDAPWAMRIEDEAPLAVVAVTHGRAWLVHPSGEPRLLAAGDIAVIRGPDHYVVAHDPAAVPTIVVDAGGNCQTLDGESVVQSMNLGVRTWGNRANGRDVMLVGTYQTEGEVSRWLVESLPAVVVVRAAEWDSPIVPLLAAEIAREDPGQQVVLDRVLDLLLVSSLRAAFAARTVDVPRWFSANADPIVGPVIRLMQDEPAAPWTVASLASAAGVSRALLARRFHELTGEPPMTFLTSWRMALAADLIVEREATVTSVARTVGYGSPFTFSTAFKRIYGVSPKAYRDRATAPPIAAAGSR